MKRLNIFLVSALLLFCSSTIIAQSQKAFDNRSTVQTEIPWFYEAPVECKDFSDVLIGTANSISVKHFKNGVEVGSNWRTIAEAISVETGEVFVCRENSLTKSDQVVHFHFNCKGDEGTRYIGSMSWDMINDPLFQNVVIHKFVCP